MVSGAAVVFCGAGRRRRGFDRPPFMPLWNLVILASYALCAIGRAAAATQDSRGEDVLVWVKPPQSTALVKGDDLVLACEVKYFDRITSLSSSSSHPPEMVYSWSKGDEEGLQQQPIPPKASVYSNHSLFVPRVGEQDFGQYTCTVTVVESGGYTKIVASANVIHAYLNPFLVQPQSQTVTTGQTFALTCVTGQSAPLLEVHWIKDGERFYEGTQITAAFGDYDEEGLRLQTSMRLDLVASDDASTGVYQCVATNKLLGGAPLLSDEAVVSMESVPSNLLPVIEWELPETLVIAEGQNLTLGCRSQVSTEPVVISWFLGRYLVDESKRVYVLPNASLAFLPVMARDRGSYHCRASNSKGVSRSPEVQLVIAYLDIQFQEEPEDTFALYGQNVVLHCQLPDSLPKASVVWYKDYRAFNVTSRPGASVADGSLHLDAVTRSDVGSYYCVAVNTMTHPSSRTSTVATLTIQGPPQMTQPPSRTRIVKGGLLHLQCLAESEPPPTVTWTFEGRSLATDDDVTIMNQGQEVWISDTGKAWEGEYSCTCTNKYGSISASATVTVIVPPVSLHEIGVSRATSGSLHTIRCPVDGFPIPTLHWFHNGSNIIEGEGPLKWRMEGLDLVIDDVTPEYSGAYRCDASNEGGGVASSGTLVVFVPPYVLETPQDVSIVVGRQGEMTCRAGGNEPPTIGWFLNNSLPVGGVLSFNNETLTFPSAGWGDVGVYTCVASNGVGVVKRSAALSIQVPPSVVSTTQPDSPVKIQSQFVLSCGANGLPPPTIKWTHLGIPVLPSLNGRVRFPMAGMLVVESAMEDDAGVYQCIAESRAGRDAATFSISIYGRPQHPTLLVALPLSSTSVYLLWDWSAAGTAGSSQTVDSFKIFYRKKSSEDVQTYPDAFPPNVTRVELLPLDPGAAYVFYVKAYNDAGASDPSNLLTAVTFHAAPSAPTNVRVLEVQQDEAVIGWEPPTSPNGVVKLYQLRYKKASVLQAYQTINITAPSFPTQEATLGSLRPFHNYTVQTRAATLHEGEELWGNYSSPLHVQTQMTVPSLTPQFVRAKAIDANGISVSWEPVPALGTNGLMTGYFISCLDDKKHLVAWHTVDQFVNKRSVFGLSPWRQYWVTVKGQNLMGMGPQSEPVIVRTLPLAPTTVPQRFTAESHSSTSIAVSWKALPSSSITCEVTAYWIRYRKKGEVGKGGGGRAWITLHIPSNYTTHVLTGLDPWTPFQVSIAAFTDTVTPGLGPYTEPVVVSTLQGESSPVTALAFTAHTTSIALSWRPPQDAKGILVGFSIHYQIVFIDSSARSVNLSVHTTSYLLTNLLPDTSYRINVNPRNEERVGQTRAIIVKTLPLKSSTDFLKPGSLTTDSAASASSSANDTSSSSSLNTSGSIALQEEDKDPSSHVRRNLASIVGGSITGAIAFIILVIFICAQCKKYRKKQRLSYDVDGEEGTVHQHNEQTPEDYQQRQLKSSTTTTTTTTTTTVSITADKCTINTNSAQAATTAATTTTTTATTTTTPQQQGDSSTEANQESITINNNSRIEDSTGSDQKANHTDGKSDKTKNSGLKRLSRPAVFQGQGYSKLDEEGGVDSTSSPVCLSEAGIITGLSSSAGGPGISSAKSADDNISIMSDTLKRRSRMRSESAAAIAVMRNSQIVSIDDSEGLIENEIHTEVIFNERTVL